jgi:uncharacterized protein
LDADYGRRWVIIACRFTMAVAVFAESGIKLPVGEAWIKDQAEGKEVLAANKVAA